MKTIFSRKTPWMYILTFLLVASLLAPTALVCFASDATSAEPAAVAETETGITDVSVSLSEDIIVKFYTVGGTKLNVEFNGENYEINESEDGVFSFLKVTPQNFNDEMTATLYDAKGVQLGEVKSFSVQSYLEELLELSYENSGCKTQLQYAAMKELAVDLLNYGAAAQTYINHDVENLANKDLTDDQKDLATGKINLTDAVTDKAASGNAWVGAGVRFDYKLGLYFVFSAESLDGVTATINDKAVTPEAYNVSGYENCWIIRFNDFTAVNMNDVVTAKLVGLGESEQTFTYSIKSYVLAKGDAGNALADLVNATYAYGFAAVAYTAEYTKNVVKPDLNAEGSADIANPMGYDFTDSKYETLTLPALNLTDYTASGPNNSGSATAPVMETIYTHKGTGNQFIYTAESYINVDGTQYSPYDILSLNTENVTVTYDETNGYTYHAAEAKTLSYIVSACKLLTITGTVTINATEKLVPYADWQVGDGTTDTNVTVNSTATDYSFDLNGVPHDLIVKKANLTVAGETIRMKGTGSDDKNCTLYVENGVLTVPSVSANNNYTSIGCKGTLITTDGGISLGSGGDLAPKYDMSNGCGFFVAEGHEAIINGDVYIKQNAAMIVYGTLKVGGNINYGPGTGTGKKFTVGNKATTIVKGDVMIGTGDTLAISGTLVVGGTITNNGTASYTNQPVTDATIDADWTWEAKS